MDEEDSFPLECSSGSGCESGWTMYLDQSFERTTSFPAKESGLHSRFVEVVVKEGGSGDEEGEDDDLSMVSDASSGPPHFHEEEDCYDENGCFFPASSAALMKKSSKTRRAEAKKEEKHSSFLDDTASSHAFCFSKNSCNFSSKQSLIEDVLDFSIGFSATHFKKHNGIVQSSSFPPETKSRKIRPAGKKVVGAQMC
ncbi:hypothetical protein AAC387_Pa05g2022 [Persea americana]